MPTPHSERLLKRRLVRRFAIVGAAATVALLAGFQFLQPLPPGTIVMASGVDDGLYRRYAQQYAALLAGHGVRVVERRTSGAAENYKLLLDPGSGVDVAFLQGGIATQPEADDLVMLASLYVEPLWIFYRGEPTLTRLNQFVGKRVSIGIAGGGTQAFVEPLLEANGVTAANSTLVTIGGDEAVRALGAGRVDVVLHVGGASSPVVQDALFDPSIRLMSMVRADAYPRRFPHVSRLTLPAGAIDFQHDVPPAEVAMIGTKAMLVARETVHPAIVNLLVDAAREIHGGQGVFEAPGEFPGTARVDLTVSPFADQHRRFGPSYLYRVMPFWAAALVERAIILLIPLLVVLVPAFNLLPRVLRWRARSRLVRWYGRLALLERDVSTRKGDAPIEQWTQELAQLERSVGQSHMPPTFASEIFTLREHIDLVRREILGKR